MTKQSFTLCLGLAFVACGGKTPLKVDAREAQGDGGAAQEEGGAPAGGESGTGGTPVAIPPICTQYCEAAALKDCPAAPGCEAACAALFPGECQDEITAFLSCAPAQLIVSCEAGYGYDGASGACLDGNDALYLCGSCAFGETSTTENGCYAQSECGLTTRCDLDGSCSCEFHDVALGTCTAIIGGIDACTPNLSCCRVYL